MCRIPRHAVDSSAHLWLIGLEGTSMIMISAIWFAALASLRAGTPTRCAAPIWPFTAMHGVPKGPLPWKYLSVAPDVVFDVRSPNDRWSELHTKVAEYLNVDVKAVCVLDGDTRTTHVFYADCESQVMTADEELSLRNILGDFRIAVRRFFE